MISQKLTELIPGDMLEYSKSANAYTVFSDEQVITMIKNCQKVGIDQHDIPLFIAEVAYDRLVQLLLNRVMAGYLHVNVSPDGNVIFKPIYDE